VGGVGMAVEESLHVARLHDAEAPELDFIRHGGEHAVLVARVGCDHHALPARLVGQQGPNTRSTSAFIRITCAFRAMAARQKWKASWMEFVHSTRASIPRARQKRQVRLDALVGSHQSRWRCAVLRAEALKCPA
jgi:hypothetical protein